MQNLTPPQIVSALDKYIVGQSAAKRAVAIALRNRYRRQQLSEELRRDVTPKNILMIGPTGVGKTEIARRVASLLDAPFIKVEATKFTEAGYVGRDVESIVFDLVETAIDMVHDERLTQVQTKAEGLATERLIGYVHQQMTASRPGRRRAVVHRAEAATAADSKGEDKKARVTRRPTVHQRDEILEQLQASKLDDTIIEIELTSEPLGYDSILEFGPGLSSDEMNASLSDFVQSYQSYGPKRYRRVSVKEARRLLTRDEANKLVDFDEVVDQAIQRVEEGGVVFIDELDKIAGPRIEAGSDVSGEGVQRDLLPIIEGSVVMTRYGPVKTDYILFIGAGAFYSSKPSDLIPELQGRFPLRVELQNLTRHDMQRILTEPLNAPTRQYRALLATEQIDLEFTPDGVERIADLAVRVNERIENIGARRLFTILEQILEDISFDAAHHAGEHVAVDAAYVDRQVANIAHDEDLSRYIL